MTAVFKKVSRKHSRLHVQNHPLLGGGQFLKIDLSYRICLPELHYFKTKLEIIFLVVKNRSMATEIWPMPSNFSTKVVQMSHFQNNKFAQYLKFGGNCTQCQITFYAFSRYPIPLHSDWKTPCVIRDGESRVLTCGAQCCYQKSHVF